MTPGPNITVNDQSWEEFFIDKKINFFPIKLLINNVFALSPDDAKKVAELIIQFADVAKSYQTPSVLPTFNRVPTKEELPYYSPGPSKVIVIKGLTLEKASPEDNFGRITFHY